MAVNAGEFHLAVKLGCLRDSKLCVNDLSLKDVNVAIDSKKMPKSAPVEEEDSKLPGVHRHARLLIADVLQAQVAPAARHLANLQPRHPAVRGVKQQMQPWATKKNTDYSFTSVWGLNYEFMEEDKPRGADFYRAAARYGGVSGRNDDRAASAV